MQSKDALSEINLHAFNMLILLKEILVDKLVCISAVNTSVLVMHI